MYINRHIRTSAFTLVELLVVISIIALLLSVLLPSLNKARNLGKAVKCASQLKQMGIGMSAYCMSNKDFFPPAQTAANWPDHINNGRPYWFQRLKGYVGQGGETKDAATQLYNYEMFKCPSEKYGTFSYSYMWPMMSGPLGKFTGSYNYQNSDVPRRNVVSQPSVRGMIIDSAVRKFYENPQVIVHQYNVRSRDKYGYGPASRHDNKLNILHADIHVARYKESQYCDYRMWQD